MESVVHPLFLSALCSLLKLYFQGVVRRFGAGVLQQHFEVNRSFLVSARDNRRNPYSTQRTSCRQDKTATHVCLSQTKPTQIQTPTTPLLLPTRRSPSQGDAPRPPWSLSQANTSTQAPLHIPTSAPTTRAQDTVQRQRQRRQETANGKSISRQISLSSSHA